jgi:hypothetical protein
LAKLKKIEIMPPLTEIKTVDNYSYMIYASRNNLTEVKAVFQLNGGGFSLGYLHFLADDIVLPKSKKLAGLFYFYYYESQLASVIDMHRNEKPIYLIYVEDESNNCRLSTSMEPVGEGEN